MRDLQATRITSERSAGLCSANLRHGFLKHHYDFYQRQSWEGGDAYFDTHAKHTGSRKRLAGRVSGGMYIRSTTLMPSLEDGKTVPRRLGPSLLSLISALAQRYRCMAARQEYIGRTSIRHGAISSTVVQAEWSQPIDDSPSALRDAVNPFPTGEEFQSAQSRT